MVSGYWVPAVISLFRLLAMRKKREKSKHKNKNKSKHKNKQGPGIVHLVFPDKGEETGGRQKLFISPSPRRKGK